MPLQGTRTFTALTYSGATILTLWGIIEIFLRIDPFLGTIFKHLDWPGWALVAMSLTALFLLMKPPRPAQTPDVSVLVVTAVAPLLASGLFMAIHFRLSDTLFWSKPVFLLALISLSAFAARLAARHLVAPQAGDAQPRYPSWFDLPLMVPVLFVGVAAILVSMGRAREITTVDIAQEELRQAGLSFSIDSLQSAIYLVSSRSVDLFRRADVDSGDIMVALGMPTNGTGGRPLVKSVMARLDPGPGELNCADPANAEACERIDEFFKLFWPSDDPTGVEFCADLARPIPLAEGNRDGAPPRALLSHAWGGGHGAIVEKIVAWCGPLDGDAPIAPGPGDAPIAPGLDEGAARDGGETDAGSGLAGAPAQSHARAVLGLAEAVDHLGNNPDERWTEGELNRVAARLETYLALVTPPGAASEAAPLTSRRKGHLLRIGGATCDIHDLNLSDRTALAPIRVIKYQDDNAPQVARASLEGLQWIFGLTADPRPPAPALMEQIGATWPATITIGQDGTMRDAWVQRRTVDELTRVVWTRADGTLDALPFRTDDRGAWMAGDTGQRAALDEMRISYLPERPAAATKTIELSPKSDRDWDITALPARSEVAILEGRVALTDPAAIKISGGALGEECFQVVGDAGIVETFPLEVGETVSVLTGRLPKGEYTVTMALMGHGSGRDGGANDLTNALTLSAVDRMECRSGTVPRRDVALTEIVPDAQRELSLPRITGPEAVCHFGLTEPMELTVEADSAQDLVLDLLRDDGPVVEGYDTNSEGVETLTRFAWPGDYILRMRTFGGDHFDGDSIRGSVAGRGLPVLDIDGSSSEQVLQNRSAFHLLTVEEQQTVAIRLDGLSADLDLSVDGPDISVESTEFGTDPDQVRFEAEPGKYYRVEVTATEEVGAGEDRPRYDLTVSEIEDSLDSQDNPVLELGDEVSGNVATRASAVHVLQLDEAGPVTVRLDGLSADLDLEVRGPDGDVVANSLRFGNAPDEARFPAREGEHHVTVSAVEAGSDFQLVARKVEPTGLTLGETVSGVSLAAGEQVFHALDLVETQPVQIVLDRLSADLDVFVWRDASGVTSGTAADTDDEIVTFTGEPGRYLIEVRAFGASAYQLSAYLGDL